MPSANIKKPIWGCESYKKEGHAWIDCDTCVDGLTDSIKNVKDDIEGCRKRAIELFDELGKLMMYQRFLDYRKGNKNGN